MEDLQLVVNAEPWQWAAIAGMTIGLTILLYGWGKDRPSPTWLLAILRLSILGILGLLLLQPMIRTTTDSKEAPTIPVLIDASSSQWMGLDSFARRTALDELVSELNTWGESGQLEVELFPFDQNTREWNPSEWNPNGKRTNLGQALETIRDRYMHRNVPAVLVVTDGRSNRGPDPEFTAERLDVPHVFIATGDTSQVTDIEVSMIRANEVAYLGNAFPVEVNFQARGAKGVPLELTFASGSNIRSSTTWVPASDLDSKRWTIQVDAEKSGTMTLAANIFPPSDWQGREITTQNNKKWSTIEVLESKRQILILARAPHPDLAAIRMAAESNRHQATSVTWLDDLQSGQSLPNHDVLILHHIDPTSLPENILESIRESRSVWMFGNVNAEWNDWGTDLVGFELDVEPLITEAQGQTPDRFESFPLPVDLEVKLSQWPPLACPTGSYQITPGLTSALNQRIGPVQTEWPLWAVREAENQRVAVTIGEGIWRWRMSEVAQSNDGEFTFDALVNRTIQYLSSRDDVRRLRTKVPEKIDEDAKVVFFAEAYDASLNPTAGVDVQLELSLRGSAATSYSFLPDDNNKRYSLELGPLIPGIYDWVISCNQDGETLTDRGTMVVNEVQIEASLIPANHGLLKRLADRTNGAVLGTLDDASDVPTLRENWLSVVKSLPSNLVVHSTSERMPLHALWWLLAALMTLMTAEWSLRRAAGSR